MNKEDKDGDSQEIEEGHDPIHPDVMASLNPKQLKKLLAKQLKDKE